MNQVNVQNRLVNWLAECEQPTELLYDEELSTENELHFDACVVEDVDDDDDDGKIQEAPEISDRMWAETKKFGEWYTFQSKSDRLHIVVREPSQSQSARLWQQFQQRKSVLMSRTWNIYFAVFGVLAFFLSFCFWTAKLHHHWHKYETPWESMFHTAFQLFIWIGDSLFARFFESPAAP